MLDDGFGKQWFNGPGGGTPVDDEGIMDLGQRIRAKVTADLVPEIVVDAYCDGVDDYTGFMAALAVATVGGTQPARGVLVLSGRQYTWGTHAPPALPKDAESLTIRGQGRGAPGERGATTILLTATAPRAFDFVGPNTDDDTFQNIRLEGFTVDDNWVGGKHHKIIGNYKNASRARANFDRIEVLRVNVINAPTNAKTSVDHCGGVWLGCLRTAVGGTQNYVTNCNFEDVDVDGGNWCVICSGATSGTGLGVNVYLDGITMRRVKHRAGNAIVSSDTTVYASDDGAHLSGVTVPVDSTARFAAVGTFTALSAGAPTIDVTYTSKDDTHFYGCKRAAGAASFLISANRHVGYPTSSNFAIGGRGFGGTSLMEDCFGSGSGDDGIETNAMCVAIHRDCEIRNCPNGGFQTIMYNQCENPEQQSIVWEDCRKFDTDPSLNSAQFGIIGALRYSLTKVTYHRCTYETARSSLPDAGSLIATGADGANFKRVVIDDFKFVAKNINHSLPGNKTCTLIQLQPNVASATLVAYNIHFEQAGTVTLNGHTVTASMFRLASTANEVQTLDLGGATSGTYKLNFGGQQTSAITATGDDDSAAILAAFVALSSVGSGNAQVFSDDAADPLATYSIQFIESLGNANQALITVTNDTTNGRGVTVTGAQDGGSPDFVVDIQKPECVDYAIDAGNGAFRLIDIGFAPGSKIRGVIRHPVFRKFSSNDTAPIGVSFGSGWSGAVNSSIAIYEPDLSKLPAAHVPISATTGQMAFVRYSARGAGTTNTQTDNYTLVQSDAGKIVEMNAASSKTITVPPNSSVPFPIGTEIGIRRYGAGALAVAQGSGVTINPSTLLNLALQHSFAVLTKRDTNEWAWAGDIS